MSNKVLLQTDNGDHEPQPIIKAIHLIGRGSVLCIYLVLYLLLPTYNL